MRTVKVRIAVAVDEKGDWAARGSRGESDEDMQSYLADDLAESFVYHWIEAEVPVPEAAVAKGEARDA